MNKTNKKKVNRLNPLKRVNSILTEAMKNGVIIIGGLNPLKRVNSILTISQSMKNM